MTTAPQQLALFESFESSSRSDAPSSAPSNGHTTSSSDPVKNGTIAAISTIQSPSATERSSRDGVGAVDSSSSDASSTAESGQPHQLSIFTERRMAEKMLDIPRPKTRAECRGEARPCPWVSCRHHLLLEVATPKPQHGRDPRPTSLRLNMASRETTKGGRRAGLQSSAAALLVRTWIDEAVELLHRMRYTCSLDVVDDYPDGLLPVSIAHLVGVTEQHVDKEARGAAIRWRAGMLEGRYLDV